MNLRDRGAALSNSEPQRHHTHGHTGKLAGVLHAVIEGKPGDVAGGNPERRVGEIFKRRLASALDKFRAFVQVS